MESEKVPLFDSEKQQLDWAREMMYIVYKNELMQYGKEHSCWYYNSRWAAHYQDLIKDKDIECLSVVADGAEVGFFIVRSGKSAKKLGVDYYIEDVYLFPNYRRMGIMEKFAKEFFKTHPGRYGMELISKNEGATKFWRSVINDDEWEGKIPTRWCKGNKVFYFKKGE